MMDAVQKIHDWYYPLARLGDPVAADICKRCLALLARAQGL